MMKLLFLLIVVAALGFVAYQMFSFFFSINNTKSQKRRDLVKLRDQLSANRSSLVSLDDDELELLSINKTGISNNPGLNPEVSGVFTSIYHEPLISFASKSYGPSASERIMIAMTSKHEFVYQTKGMETTVMVDNQEIGTIHSDGNLYDMKDRLVAHIEADNVLATHPVKVGQREVGEIINPLLASSPNPRAYTFLEPMDNDERVLFMSLTLLSLIEESV